MPGSIWRFATVGVAALFVGLNVGAATAQVKLNMPTRNEESENRGGEKLTLSI